MAFGRKIPPSESLSQIGTVQPHSTNHHQASSNRPDEAPEALQTRERFELREPRYRIKDLILPEAVLRQIGILKSRIENHKLIYHEWEFQKIDPVGAGAAVNFYGPPGTGKTMCAEALASAMGKQIL